MCFPENASAGRRRFLFAVTRFASASATAPTAGRRAAQPLPSMLSGPLTSLNIRVKQPNSAVNTSALAVGRRCSPWINERQKSSSGSCQKLLHRWCRAMSSGSNAASRGYDRSKEPRSTRRTERDGRAGVSPALLLNAADQRGRLQEPISAPSRIARRTDVFGTSRSMKFNRHTSTRFGIVTCTARTALVVAPSLTLVPRL
jgi:hypothetical protein